jgi:O-antigen/teichoic acid export membrane protein
MRRDQSLSSQALTLIAARSISFILSLGIPLVLVRCLTQGEFGAYKQSILLCSTLINLLPWGMSQSLYYFIPKEPENRRGYLSNSFLFLLCMGTLSFIGFYFSGPLLEKSFRSQELGEMAPLLGLYTFFMISSLYAEVALVSNNRAGAAAIVILLNEIFKAAALIGGALIIKSFTGIMIGLAVAAGVRFILMTLYFHKDLKNIFSGPDLRLLKKQWSYSMPFGMVVVFIVLQDYFHQYYISYTYGADLFAIYAVGCLQLPLVDLFYSSIGDVSMVKMTEHLRTGDKVGARTVWHEAMLKLAVIFYPLTVYLAVVSTPFIVALYTKQYLDSIPIFLITLLSMPLTVLLTDPALRVLGDTRFMLWISVVRIPITISLVVMAVKQFGMIGAAGGALLAVFLVRTVMLARISSQMEADVKTLLPWRNLVRILVAALLSAIPILLVMRGFSMPPKLELVVTAPVYGLTFLFLGLWLNIFPEEERNMVKQVYRRIMSMISPKTKVLNTETEVSG